MTLEDVFGLTDAKTYDCYLHDYHVGHSTLRILAHRNEHRDRKMLLFSGVEYFSGSTRWSGATFVLANADETLEAIGLLPHGKALISDAERKIAALFLYKLYKHIELDIKILASRAIIDTSYHY